MTFIILLIILIVLGGAYYFLFMRKGGGNQGGGNKMDSSMHQGNMPSDGTQTPGQNMNDGMSHDENNSVSGI